MVKGIMEGLCVSRGGRTGGETF